MKIKRSESRPSAKAPAEWFTGTVRTDPLFPKARGENSKASFPLPLAV